MNNTNDIELEMYKAVADMHEQIKKDDAEYARKFRIASVFLAERVLDDLVGVKRRMGLKEPVGSYISNQKVAANKAMERQMQKMKDTAEFLKQANNDYFLGEETSNEAKATIGMLVDYFRGDSSKLKLAKISDDIEDFKIANVNPAISFVDIVFTSLESTHPDIFNK